MPLNFDLIREKCPAIVREKVNDLMSVINNNANFFTNHTANYHRFMSKTGSGRILRKAFSSFNDHYSKSFDELVEETHDTNNNQGFRRATSTMCLNNLRFGHLKEMAAHEA